ncbi:hypothetical protein THRCLA_06093 [Thraustotheca clavata]|uniref:Helicase-associated domain-containing protein n=1 Tax=Thraustotheca clavata TaxID=74557 RepID=A0A1V9ZR54_9STRA|nr:hypothetical protein THRCLA_06093 [Thraustotheca clavata]
MKRWYSTLKRLPLSKQRDFVDVARVFRQLQAPTSDFTLLPATFRVPEHSPWPETSQGSTITSFHFRAAYEQGTLAPEIVQELAAINFVWRQRDYVWDRNIVAFKKYKNLHGHLDIPIDYVVPQDENWPKDVRGLKLGMVVHSFRRLWLQKKLPKEKTQILDNIGIIWHVPSITWSRKLLALKTYRKIYGNAKVSRHFIVPVHDGWPKEIWHLRLGDVVAMWRCYANALTPDQVQALDSIGFIWELQESEWNRKLLALRTYKQLYGHVDVPKSFIVPEDDIEWPDELWEYELGKVVASLRQAELTPERQAEITSLGFTWKYQSNEWAKKLKAFQCYKKIYGDLNIPRHFQVPRHDKLWPEELWWMPLGQITRQLRARKHKGLTAERREQLDAIGFEWYHQPKLKSQVLDTNVI